jgi:hypothetical protein
VAGAIAEPFVNSINLIIEGLNRLPGVHLEKMENVVTQGAEALEKLTEQEYAKLEMMQEIRELGNEQLTSDAIAKETIEQKHSDKMNAIEKAKLEKSKTEKNLTALEELKNERSTTKQRLQDQIDYSKLTNQIDTELLNLKINSRGLDTANYQTWSGFMMNSLDKNSRWQFNLWKAFAIQQAIVNTHAAAIAGYNAMVGIPIVGPALGAAAAAAAIAFGGAQVARISTADFQGAEEGAVIRGVPGSTGNLIRVGENNKDEAIIPLEDDEAQERLGRLGGTTIIFNVETMFADDEFPREVALKIDDALYNLREHGLSKL